MTNMITANLDAEIAKAKKQAAARIAKLKRDAAAEQKKVDAKVIELLREQEPDLHEGLSRQAVGVLAVGKAAGTKSVRRVAPMDSLEPMSINDARGAFVEEAR